MDVFKIKRANTIFILIVLAYSLYAGSFIYRTTYVIDGKRFFSLFDDAMISMKYAKSFVGGHGLVWNPGGAKVEGYTNTLWVLYMAIFHLFPIDPSKISLCIQVSGALFLIANLFFVKKIADIISDDSVIVSISAVFLTAFYFPLNYWGLLGMEVSVLTLIISASIWKALECIKSGKFSIWLYVLLGIGTLVRPDIAVPFLAIIMFLTWVDSENREKHIKLGLLLFVSFVFSQTLFRYLYFGEIFPNTYYLKMTGYPAILRITRGLYVFLEFIWKTNWILFSIPFCMLLFKRDKKVYFLFWILLAQAAYSIYVGGDAWESWGGSNRFLSVVAPVFFVLFCCSLEKIWLFIADRMRDTGSSLEENIKYYFFLTVVVSLISFNAFYGPGALVESLLVRRAFDVINNQKRLDIANLIPKVTNKKAKILVSAAGIIPYFADRFSLDLLGKNDRKIAHEKVDIFPGLLKYIGFHPGHTKWNLKYSIGELKPDVVVQVFGMLGDAKPYLENDYVKVNLRGHTLYVLKKSPNILWDNLAKFSEEGSSSFVP